mmetsp:Transcript_19582/g.42599  ORF Transcript_19582/g.42599 Transcript_19582/m.42599 type:complete len:938 (-) Transcript_19582:260-3073(-)
MAWRNRITGSIKSNGFRKMGKDLDENYDVPLLLRTSSSLASMNSPRSNSGHSGSKGTLGFQSKAFSKNSKNNSPVSIRGSLSSDTNSNSNIAAVPDEIEALSFLEDNKNIIPVDNKNNFNRTSSNNSPISILEENPSFVAQFDLVNGGVEEKSDLDITVFDDDTFNDGSMYDNAHNKQSDSDHKQDDCEDLDRSLLPPSLADSKDYDYGDEHKPKYSSNKSSANSLSKNSKTSLKSKSRSNRSRSRLSRSSGKSRNYIDEDADAATWNAEENDDFLDVDDFGNCSERSPALEISGINLLTERDRFDSELQETNHLMIFNALVLIQKQRDWIEGSIDATNGANKGSSNMIMMELSNLERKIKLLMDHKEWPNELERKKQKIHPLTPSKAFFKAMALIDRSIEQFHKGYLKYMSNTGEENHKLKTRVDDLVKLNDSLQEKASRSQQKTETIRNLQKEREDLSRKVERTDEKLASLLPNEGDSSSPITPNNHKKDSKFHSVKSYIQKLEAEREKHLVEIQSLKTTIQNPPAVAALAEDNENENEGNDSEDKLTDEKTNFDGSSVSVITENTDDDSDSKQHEKTDVLRDDLGSKWHNLDENENAIALVANKEKQVDRLSKTVAEQECSLDSIRNECNLMRMQLLQLETNRNEFKYQCGMKDSALLISQDRIATLEEEVLTTRARCITYEEDYEAMKESLDTQKMATRQESFHSEDEVKAQFEQIRTEFEEKLESRDEELRKVKEDRERLVRDLKASMKDVEAERDNLQVELNEKNAAAIVLPLLPPRALPTEDSFKEEKKESDEAGLVSASSVAQNDAIHFEQMQSRFAEKASKQANKIAQLTEQNDIKDEQLKALQDMVEMLLGDKAEARQEDSNRPWGQRMSKLRAMSQRGATELMNRSRHGGSTHGSRHGSRHGTRHGASMHGSMHGSPDEMEEYSNR